MLHSISWFQFIAFLLTGLVIYYGYVFIRYFREDIREWRSGGKDKGRKSEDKDGDVVSRPDARTGSRKISDPQLPNNAPGQAGLFPEPAAGDEVPELFKAMEKVI